MKMHHTQIATGFLMALLAGAGLGYFLGFDHGWESAIAEIVSSQQ